MISFIRVTQSLIFIFTAWTVSAEEPQIILSNQTIYSYKLIGDTKYYSKLEPSGCYTKIILSQNRDMVGLLYGDKCNTGHLELENVRIVADSLIDIIAYFKLAKVVKSKNMLFINYLWKISHWPLINTINEDDTWPKDFSLHYKKSYSELKQRDIKNKFRESLQNKILESTVYFPFVDTMNKVGCNLTLAKDYADPIYFDKKYLTKKELIKWGIYTSLQAKKDIYPLIKGPVGFNMNCANMTIF